MNKWWFNQPIYVAADGLVMKLEANGTTVILVTTIAFVVAKPDTKHFDKLNVRVSVVTLFDLSLLVVY